MGPTLKKPQQSHYTRYIIYMDIMLCILSVHHGKIGFFKKDVNTLLLQL